MGRHFEELSATTRARFAAAVARARFTDARPPSLIEPAVALVGLVAVTAGAASVGFGWPDHDRFLQPSSWLVGYAAAGVAIALMATTLLRRLRDRRRPRGTHLLEGEWVEAGDEGLDVWPLDEVDHVTFADPVTGTYVGTDVQVTFRDGHVGAVRVRGEGRARELVKRIERMREKVAKARADGDDAFLMHELVFEGVELPRTDPVAGGEGPYRAPDRVAALRAPRRRGFLIPLALVGGVLGSGLWPLRNHLSDEAGYERALRADTIAVWNAYRRKGHNHLQVVEHHHLPEAHARRRARAEAERPTHSWPGIDAALRGHFRSLAARIDEGATPRIALDVQIDEADAELATLIEPDRLEREVRTRFVTWWDAQWDGTTWDVRADAPEPLAHVMLVARPQTTAATYVFERSIDAVEGVGIELELVLTRAGSQSAFTTRVVPPSEVSFHSIAHLLGEVDEMRLVARRHLLEQALSRFGEVSFQQASMAAPNDVR